MQFNSKKMVLTVVASAIALMAQAQQQSNVEIYGQVGLSVTSKNHQSATDAKLTEMATNTINVSHLGFRGREDLGDGLSALFRLEASMALLQSSSLQVSEIAARCGYDSHSRFSAAFRQRFGYAPSHLRS